MDKRYFSKAFNYTIKKKIIQSRQSQKRLYYSGQVRYNK